MATILNVDKLLSIIKQTNEKEFFSNGNKELRFDEIDKLTDQQFKQRFAESPILRTKLKGLKRNADIINFWK